MDFFRIIHLSPVAPRLLVVDFTMASSSSTMSNPYANRNKASRRREDDASLESILRTLVSATASKTSSYSVPQWTQLEKALRDCGTEQWTVPHAETFLDWVIRQVKNKEMLNDDHAVRSLYLLATLLQHKARGWSGNLVYALSVPRPSSEGTNRLLQIALLSQNKSQAAAVQSASCVCLAAIWRSLSKVDALTLCGLPESSSTVDAEATTAWWIRGMELSSLLTEKEEESSDGYWEGVLAWSLDQWLVDPVVDDDHHHEEGSDPKLFERETLKASAGILLTQLLQTDSTSVWLYSISKAKWRALTERLVEESQRLVDPNMPMTSFARLSLVSLHLLALLERKTDRDMPHTYGKLLTGNGGLVSVLMKAALTGDGPRWCEGGGMEWIVPLLAEWGKGGTLMVFWEMESRSEMARIFLKDVVERMRDGSAVPETRLSTLSWLLRETPSLCRNVVTELIPRDGWAKFVGSMASLVMQNKASLAMEAAGVLSLLVGIQTNRSLQVDDELCTGAVAVEQIIVKVSSSMGTLEHRPLLLLLLDTLQTLDFATVGQAASLGGLAADLLPVMLPSGRSVVAQNGNRMDMDSSMDSDESTPPANNLSRLDESRLTLPETDESEPKNIIVYGLEPCISIAAASVIASFVKSQERAKQLGDCRDQLSDSLHEFLESESMLMPDLGEDTVSEGTRLRKACLLKCVVKLPDESYFTPFFVNAERSMSRAKKQSRAETLRLKQRVQWLERRELALSESKESLDAQLHAQSTSAQRDRNLLHRKLVNDSRETLNMEISQRVAAEKGNQDLRATMKKLEDRVATSDSQNQALQISERECRAALSEGAEKTQRLETEVNGLRDKHAHDQHQLERLSEEAGIANRALDKLKKKEEHLCVELAHRDEDLDRLEASRAEMHSNLESLFGDMVSLAHAYEVKENDVSSHQQNNEATIEKLQEKLEQERRQREDLERKYQQAEYENDALSRKYAKAREKLEEERNNRKRDTQLSSNRRGASVSQSSKGASSKSYIQQLQLSHNTSHASSRSGKENDPRKYRDSSKR
jgi:hypothetical protein